VSPQPFETLSPPWAPNTSTVALVTPSGTTHVWLDPVCENVTIVGLATALDPPDHANASADAPTNEPTAATLKD
jgi:hypothetical protein